jgi:membrane protein YqaA with SNARE-associated domain
VWWLSGVMASIGLLTFMLMFIPGLSEAIVGVDLGSVRDLPAGRWEGYVYLALYSIPSNTAISVFPHEPVLIEYGKIANLWWCATAATTGTMVAGWLDHRVFVPVLNYTKITSYKESRFYKRSKDIFMRYPFATLVVTGFTPIPFFPFKFLCFSIHYPLWRYLTALAVARFPRYYLLALVGYLFGIPTWILIASVVVIFGLYAFRGIPAVWRRIKERRRRNAEAQAESSSS